MIHRINCQCRIILAGINDILLHGKSAEEVFVRLRELYTAAASAGCTVVAVQLLPAESLT
jgi:hypothetical protein